MSAGTARRRWLVGMGFLLPNFLGFCAFTLVPLALSFGMAFTDWDILRHNIFRHEALHFVGFDNFTRLFGDPQFWRDLGNTLFLMLGLPFGIAGSLGAALLLTRVGRRRCAVGPALVVATLIFVASGLVLLRGGMAGGGLAMLLGTFSASVLVAGVLTRGTVYRTLFYIPSFTSGIATFVLWKNLYNPHGGPINLALSRLGFDPPNWLGDYGWAKPALMIMALWAAIGSNNMILYLAALGNVSPELYEAAEIDGASPGQRFWNITWPQLAPTTFFIVVTGVVAGLQGGFEMARPMTQGGPAGATTTLSYLIFTEGFETGRLAYASAVAWFLFVLVFILSLLNFRFLNRHADD